MTLISPLRSPARRVVVPSLGSFGNGSAEEFVTGFDDTNTPSSFMAATGTSYTRCRAPFTALVNGRALQIGFYLGSVYAATEGYAAIYRHNSGALTLLGYADIGTPTLNSWNYISMPSGIVWAAGEEIVIAIATNNTAYLGRETTGGDGMLYRAGEFSGQPIAYSSSWLILANHDVAYNLRWRETSASPTMLYNLPFNLAE